MIYNRFSTISLPIPGPAQLFRTGPGLSFLLLLPTVSARQGPCPGLVFSYSNRTKNPIPGLDIPGSFMDFPGSLLPLYINTIYIIRAVIGCSQEQGLYRDYFRH